MFGDWTGLTVLLYVLGLLLLVVEGLIPGFGFFGITGVVCVVISIVMITSNLYDALLLIISTIAIFVIIIAGLYKLGYGSKYLKFLILDKEQKKEEGYTSSNKDYSSYLGKVGVADTPLRPSGVVIIEGNRVNAQSEGNFIPKDSKVIVTHVDGMKIIVKNYEEES